MLKSIIADPRTGLTAEIADGEEINGLVVATRPLKYFDPEFLFFNNFTYGSNLNINAGFTGTPDIVHNGLDSSLWTASAISGIWDFQSTDQAHTGIYSINGTETVDGNVAQFTKGSIFNVSNYVALTGWIYLTFWSTVGIKQIYFYGWDTTSGVSIGNEISISDYINTTSFNVWQKFTIPFVDFNFNSNIDAIRIRTNAGPQPVDFYLDDIQFEKSGNVITYKIDPPRGKWLHVKNIKYMFADAYSTILASSSMPNLSYNKILGETLNSGITLRIIKNKQVVFTENILSISDLLSLSNTSITNTMCDGTNTYIDLTSDIHKPIILKSSSNDYISLTISEDLSGLLLFKASISGYSEIRPELLDDEP